MQADLHLVAQQQGGVFTTAQARGVGVGERALTRLRRQRSIVSIGRSVYAFTPDWPEREVDRLAARTRGAVALYPDAVPCGASDLALRDIPLFGVDTSRADIVRPVHREVLTGLCRIREPHPVIRPGTTTGGTSEGIAGAVVQTALDHGHVPAVVAGDHVLHRELTTLEAIDAAFLAVEGWPDAGRVRTMRAFLDGRSESVGETRLRLFVRALGWSVIPQLPIADDHDEVFAYADLGVEGTNLLLEFDGRVKYGEGSDALWREKQREDRIRRRGYGFERVIWSDLDRPVVLTARLQAALARSSSDPRGLPSAS